MTTSISSKAFCSITDRQTDKIFTEQIVIYKGSLNKKNWSHILIRGRENHISPYTWLTDGQKYGHLLLQSSFATKNKDDNILRSSDKNFLKSRKIQKPQPSKKASLSNSRTSKSIQKQQLYVVNKAKRNVVSK